MSDHEDAMRLFEDVRPKLDRVIAEFHERNTYGPEVLHIVLEFFLKSFYMTGAGDTGTLKAEVGRQKDCGHYAARFFLMDKREHVRLGGISPCFESMREARDLKLLVCETVTALLKCLPGYSGDSITMQTPGLN